MQHLYNHFFVLNIFSNSNFFQHPLYFCFIFSKSSRKRFFFAVLKCFSFFLAYFGVVNDHNGVYSYAGSHQITHLTRVVAVFIYFWSTFFRNALPRLRIANVSSFKSLVVGYFCSLAMMIIMMMLYEYFPLRFLLNEKHTRRC